ncbi:hypothetical protein TPHA_0N00890 [Tetrapisispora phaffii CBS 4417]|uniref:Uncharacterized protein n=1 Tax=Tetrapisispora phaffii (strain ATCC 24235 / CBS 4417 / NBRC 1672 / NRRL Y-8282 / UCD 70-5) TaxID=1071381 RepID=G8C142_TETPH|nr:hypothetical protein TPHA_0N00890 [Tetrapisispora phaffii CBS 4417]CCE65870.1 hypothetical protein TPHA_0N00890 [Tetrapisispora phaffii CBS 4417]
MDSIYYDLKKLQRLVSDLTDTGSWFPSVRVRAFAQVVDFRAGTDGSFSQICLNTLPDFGQGCTLILDVSEPVFENRFGSAEDNAVRLFDPVDVRASIWCKKDVDESMICTLEVLDICSISTQEIDTFKQFLHSTEGGEFMSLSQMNK